MNATSVPRLFSAERPELTVTDAAPALGLPKSSISRLLRAMRDAGLLSGVGNAPRYRIATLLFEIGRLHRQNSTLINLVDPALAETLAFCLSFSAPQVAEIELQRTIIMLTKAARRVAERVDDALWRSVPSELAA